MSMNNDPMKVITGRARLSYVNLFTPRSNQPGEDPKYSTTVLIPKSDFTTKQKIDAAIQAAVQAGVAERFGGQRPPMLNLPIHDGDGVRPSDGTPYGDECKGHWVLSASTKQKPEIVDMSLNPIMSQTEVYSGIYGRVSVRFYPYNTKGKKGIGCGLNNVQKLEDGEPLGGRSSASSDFGGSDFSAPAQPQYQQQYQAPVQQQYQAPAQQQPAQYQAPVQQPVQYQAPVQQYQAPVQQPQYQAPVQQPQYQAPIQQPVYNPQPQQQIDPITGLPVSGPIYGL